MALLVSHEVGKGLNFEQCGNHIYNVRGFGKGIAFSMHYAFTIRIVESNGNKQSGKRKGQPKWNLSIPISVTIFKEPLESKIPIFRLPCF